MHAKIMEGMHHSILVLVEQETVVGDLARQETAWLSKLRFVPQIQPGAVEN
jgi:hypothetical protein